MSKLKKFATIAATGILALGLAACADGPQATPVDTSEDDAVIEDAVVEEETPAEDEPPEDETDEDEAPAEGDGGTRDNPYPAGQTVEVTGADTGDWRITLNEVNNDAGDVIAAENQFNDPAEGTYIMSNWTFEYLDGEDDPVSPFIAISIDFVTADGNTIATYDSFAVTPDELDTTSDLFKGGSITGNISVDTPNVDGTWRVKIGFFDQKDIFFEN